MGNSLDGKVALVTGGAGGIGSAICHKLALEGADIIVTYNSNKTKAEQLLEKLPDGNHSIFHAPNTDKDLVNVMQKEVSKMHGKLDILVNNAGVTTPVSHNDLDGLTDQWIDRIMQVNVRGSFAMIRAFKPLLEKSGDGLVVNISSVAAQTGIGSNVAYCSSKAALDCMAKSLGRALAPSIRVVSVSPGWVLGDYAKSMDPAYIKEQEDLTPLGRLASTEDVADTVFALTSYLKFTTGSVIPVDGGRALN